MCYVMIDKVLYVRVYGSHQLHRGLMAISSEVGHYEYIQSYIQINNNTNNYDS